MARRTRRLDRRIHFDLADAPGTYGVVTAADEAYAFELRCLLESLNRQHRIPVHVFDLGLAPESLEWLTNRDLVTVYSIDRVLLERAGDHWQAWWKPLYLQQSPFDYSLWLDADCIVVGPLGPLFGLLTEIPIVTTEHLKPDECINRPELYERLPVTGAPVPINSGVVGICKGRDDILVCRWLDLVTAAADDPELAALIQWWDQGALEWAIRALDWGHLVLYEREWNQPARKTLYDRDCDLVAAVTEDNIGAVIVHFADLKLSSLSRWCDDRVAAYLETGLFVRPGTVHAFCVGLERAGTHTIARALAGSCHGFGWIRHECRPTLSREAAAVMAGRPPGPGLARRLELYDRNDAAVVFEANHRLAFFMRELDRRYPGCKFILLTRDPVELIESRIRSTSHWAPLFSSLPIFYQQYILDHKYDGTEQSNHRIAPQDSRGMSLLELHLWELRVTLETLLQQAAAFGHDRVIVCDTYDLPTRIADIADFIDPDLFDHGIAQALARQKHDTTDGCPVAIRAFARAVVDGHQGRVQYELRPLIQQFQAI